MPIASLAERLIDEADQRTRRIAERREQLMAIARQAQALPSLDGRDPDDIIGYDAYGLPSR